MTLLEHRYGETRRKNSRNVHKSRYDAEPENLQLYPRLSLRGHVPTPSADLGVGARVFARWTREYLAQENLYCLLGIKNLHLDPKAEHQLKDARPARWEPPDVGAPRCALQEGRLWKIEKADKISTKTECH